MHMQRLFRRTISLASVLALLMATPVGAANRVNSIEFDASGKGIASGFVEDGLSFVSTTDDGGQSFHAWSPPAPTGYPEPNAFYLSGAAFRGDLAVTFMDLWDYAFFSGDAAATFARKGPILNAGATSIRDAAVLKGGRIVLIGRDEGNLEIGNPAFILSSVNGGDTWKKDLFGPTYVNSEDATSLASWSSLHAIDADEAGQVAWAVGSEGKKVNDIYYYLGPLVRKTVDGGANWTTQTANVGWAEGYTLAATLDTQTAFAANFAETKVVRTVNGGSTWTAFAFPYSSALRGVMKVKSMDARPGVFLAGGPEGEICWSTNPTATTPTYTFRRLPSRPALRGAAIIDANSWMLVGDGEAISRTDDAGLTWQDTGSQPPVVSLLGPANGGSITAAPLVISGTASDAGLGVKSVDVRIRRADGVWLNPLGSWQTTETWLPAETADGWHSWTATWTGDPALAAAGHAVTITGRATDAVGLTALSTMISLAPIDTSSITLAGGEQYTNNRTVSASVFASGASKMDWSLDGGSTYSEKVPAASTVELTLPGDDGEKSAEFRFFAEDGVTQSGAASDTITLDATNPSLSMSTPSAGFGYQDKTSIVASGSVEDTTSGLPLSAVHVSISQDGQYWSGDPGVGWTADPTWLHATVDGNTWSYNWELDDASRASGRPVTIAARAYDNAGNHADVSRQSLDPKDVTSLTLTSSSSTLSYNQVGYLRGYLSREGVESAGTLELWQKAYPSTYYKKVAAPYTTSATGTFSISVRPAVKTSYIVKYAGNTATLPSATGVLTFTPKVYLATPSGPYSVKRGTRFGSSVLMKPIHTPGTYPVRIYKERYVSGTWKSYGYVLAKASTYYAYSRCTATLSLPYAGKWRIRAYHYDAGHAATYSSYRTIYVK